jgi:glycosyltransferase involved in cell wall biosynthesis
VVAHGPPDKSIEAFPRNGIVVVPLRVASGVRMKILEAWSRGLPVVATPEAAAGLKVKAGNELLIARNAQDFTEALAALASLPALRKSLLHAGRTMLREKHAPEKIAGEYVEVFEELRVEN